MARKCYDAEFMPAVLQARRKAEILSRANPVYCSVLDYNVRTFAVELESRFQDERKRNPLLETTPEAWLAAEIIPDIEKIRPNVDVNERLLSEALQRYFRQSAQKASQAISANDAGEVELHTTLEPYKEGIAILFSDLLCRSKSLRGILRLPRNAYTLREAMRPSTPSSRREKTFVKGITENWPNQRIARELGALGQKPRSRVYRSYSELLKVNPDLFNSLKSGIKKKYSGPGTPTKQRPLATLSKKSQA